MGASAPDRLDYHEVWFDVGGRNHGQVFDHHSGETEERSTLGLVLKRGSELAAAYQSSDKQLTFVTHVSPDIDGISAVWLFREMVSGSVLGNEPWLVQLARRVGDHDQGFEGTMPPLEDGFIHFIAALTLSGPDDNEKMTAGLKFMDTMAGFHADKSKVNIAEYIPSGETTQLIAKALEAYDNDKNRADTDTILLTHSESGKDVMVDALFITDPTSTLFKHFARRDVVNSRYQKGFQFLCISLSIETEETNNELWRHVISVVPETSCALKGLGRLFEEAEQNLEEGSGVPLLPGRERLEKGKGRFGGNIASPWYDGRGHNFTIIDAPSVLVDGKPKCASRLKPENIRNIIYDWSEHRS
jgi:hypothetical protein